MKTAFIFTVSFTLLLSLSLPFPSLSERCNPKDKKVLLQIKKDLNNPYHLASWNPQVDCCQWYVVKCDRNTNRIVSLTMFAGNISGQIPDAVGDLPYLQTLMFHKLTNLTGHIPPAIAKLSHLKELRISWTNISGPIPSFLSQLKNLTLLELSFNELTGSIPPSLAELQNLDTLYLDRNKLTGTIPESFGKFTAKPVSLHLSLNQLSGTIPRSLGNSNFNVLEFSRNKLEGDISFLFGSNKTLMLAFFDRNMFKFDLSKVQIPDSLTSLDLSHNAIFGSLPAGLAGVQFLNVSYNRLCGKIPTIGQLQTFDYTAYFHNRCLCGAPLTACK